MGISVRSEFRKITEWPGAGWGVGGAEREEKGRENRRQRAKLEGSLE
jgi:hypothetical protein